MRRIYDIVVGVLLLVAAVTGFVLSIGGIIGLGAVQGRIESSLNHQLGLLDQALSATDAGLRTASDSVKQSQATLASIQGTMDSSATSIDDIIPAVEAMGGVIGTQLPDMLDGAANALTGFADTAGVIDKVMGVLTSVPFIDIPAYDPNVPLSESVTKVRDSVGGLGDRLQDIDTSLTNTATNLKEVRGEMSGVSTALGGLGESLNGAVEVVGSYQEIVADLRSQVDMVSQGITDALRWARVVVTIILFWLAIASLGLLTLGWDLLHRDAGPTAGAQ